MNRQNLSGSALVTILVIAIIAILVGPFLLIWSLNTLFGLTIAYGFFEWLAALLILGFLKQSPVKVNKPE